MIYRSDCKHLRGQDGPWQPSGVESTTSSSMLQAEVQEYVAVEDML